jgi:hypothetical protein
MTGGKHKIMFRYIKVYFIWRKSQEAIFISIFCLSKGIKTEEITENRE